MIVGISTATFFLKELTEDTFSVIQRCGGQTCEVFLTTYSEYEPEFASLLLQRKGDLDVYSVHSLNTQFEPQLFNPAPRTRSDAEGVFRKVLAAGKTLGARVYTFHGLSRLKKGAYFDPAEVGKRMSALGDIAGEYGITLCLENGHWAVFNTPAFYADMKKHAPNCGCVLDIKQARQSGYDWKEYLDVMQNTLKNVHISDADSYGNIAMAGKGVFPFEELITRLNGIGYDGPLMLEQYAKNYDDYREVAQSVEYLKNLVGGLK